MRWRLENWEEIKKQLIKDDDPNFVKILKSEVAESVADAMLEALRKGCVWIMKTGETDISIVPAFELEQWGRGIVVFIPDYDCERNKYRLT